ncbi:hypothetical protein TRFO_14644 [Tritrichomonas foetus]|uniref:Piezo non-specific cation channel cap domain-containing protein n=1 Tax=Tritrichomonas foetus TaxID=1144522 RepID=A0A1J4KUL9_9EUKA|nr:hypothetical protein TRFO_14644 [Tritrichomonas foetus]|eukprot:OHT14977.1 hypothetical protein TRFO_14644 [Tritrichomonas foetus]
MESSDQSAGSNESDSFFAVGTIVDSIPESPPPEEEILSIESYPPIYMVIILYFLCPIFHIFCAMATTSFLGLFFLLLIVCHQFILSRSMKSYTGITAFLYFEILYTLLVFIVAIVCNSDPDMSIPSQVVGSSFNNYIASTPGFAIFATFVAIVFESIPISLMSHTTFSAFDKCRNKIFQSVSLGYAFDLIHIFSLAFLFSTNASFLWYPLLIYYLYCNISLVFCGKEKVYILIFWVMTIYTLFYAFFEFYMCSFIGEYWNPSKSLKYQYIAPKSAKWANIVFSSFLVYTSVVLMTGPGWKKGKTKDIPYIIPKFINFLVIIFYFGTLLFSLFFPNYLTVLWIIIVFFCAFSNLEAARRLFYPFLTFIYSISFFVLIITQYDAIPHPHYDGRDQPFSFMKLFGLFKYQNNDNDRYGFSCGGFFILAYIGQLGRILNNTTTKCRNLHRFDRMEDVSDSAVKSQIRKAKRNLLWRKFVKRARIIFNDIFQFFYKVATYFSLPICSVIAIYCGYYKTRWAFQIFSVLYELIILLFLYYKWSFQIVKFLSALIILVCTFYKSSDNYECRETDNCLFYGYFRFLEESGISPSPDYSLHLYLWPMTIIFLVSVFLTYEQKSLRVYYSSLVIFILYVLIALSNFIYAFIFPLTVFSLVYFILGCIIIGTLVLHWYNLRTFAILLCFIAISIQLSLYSLSHLDSARNFLNAHVSVSFIDVHEIIQPNGEIIILAFMLFMCSIVFHGSQKLHTKDLTFHLIQEMRKILHEFYFYISWILIFGFSMVNNYPTFFKFIFLLIFFLGSVSSNFFNSTRYPLLFIFFIFFIVQISFHLFVNNLQGVSFNVLRYLGVYLTDKDELTDHEKNYGMCWQFCFILVSILNLKPYSSINHPSEFEARSFTRLYYGISAMLHNWLPVIVQGCLCFSTIFNITVFGWITFIILLCTVYCSNFFERASIAATCILCIIFLAQYLFYLGFPNNIFECVTSWSIIHCIPESAVDSWIPYLRFLGIYDVSTSSLIMVFISCIACTFFLQYNDKTIDYKQSYDNLPSLAKSFTNFITLNFFEISVMCILIVASLLQSLDGLIFFVVLSFFFIANLLYDYNPNSTMAIISAYIFTNIGLRILSRIPLFVATGLSVYLQRAFDLPFQSQSRSSSRWLIIFILQRLCNHVMRTDLYRQLQESHTKHCAYRYIRERQLRIIEKLDQDILLKNRNQEINALNRKSDLNLHSSPSRPNSNSNSHLNNLNSNNLNSYNLNSNNLNSNNLNSNNLNSNNLHPLSAHTISSHTLSTTNLKNESMNLPINGIQSSFNFSDTNIHMVSSEIKPQMIDDQNKKDKWYRCLYLKFIVPQLNRLIRLLAGCLPINYETGLNVLTLESLTLLMRRCLSHYERNTEFHLEERERQFLISLPPSFWLQYSSIAHLLDMPPIIETTELIFRYSLFLLRKISILDLVLISVIYMYTKPYIFGIIIFVYVVFVFLSLDFKGFANIYRIFLVIVLIILGFRTISRTDMIIDRLEGVSGSLTNIQNRISTLSLIGMEPDENIAIEILLFAATVFYIIDQVSSMKVFPSNYYYEKLSSILPGFPMEYCYGIMDDPIRNLGMNIPQTRTFFDAVKEAMKRTWLRSSSHHTYMLVIDIISFFLLLAWWLDWERGNDEYASNGNYSFRVNALYVFILVIHVIFCLSVYFCCLGDLHFPLFLVEFVWLVYEFSIIFFYIRSKNKYFPGTAQFYIFLRILQHLIAAHKCFCGRTYVSYHYPQFITEWKQIRLFDKFIRWCPFVFEIQTILLWIGKPTLVPLVDFCIIRDMELQLEIMICNKYDKKYNEKPEIDNNNIDPKIQYKKKEEERSKNRTRICCGICSLILFIFIVFIPLFFLVQSTEEPIANKVILASIQAGIGTFPPFYETTGFVREISNSEHQELADSSQPAINEIATQNHHTLYIVDFPIMSPHAYKMSVPALNNLENVLTSDLSNLSAYVKLSLIFDYPTTSGHCLDPSFLKVSEFLEMKSKLELLSVLTESNNTISGFVKLPHIIFATSNEILQSLETAESSFNFTMTDKGSWKVSLEDTTDLGFIRNSSDYILVVYSQPVQPDSSGNSSESTNGSFIGVYLLMLIILGIVIRENVSHQVDGLWRKKMEHPIKLYRMIVAINIFKNAGDIETEKEMSDLFLNTMRSQEKVISVTSTEND